MISWLEKKRSFAVLLTSLIAIGIFLISSIPGGKVATNTGNLDLSIAYHLTAFFLLNFFLLVSLNGKNKIKTRYIFIVLLISIAYAILDEIHQIFVPFRYPDVRDVLVDSLGIFLATAVYFYAKRLRR